MWVCEKNYDCIDCPKKYEDCECDYWIEVEPVRCGHWIEKEWEDFENWKDDGWKHSHWSITCSICNKEFYYGINNNKTNYCPNCGARMVE